MRISDWSSDVCSSDLRDMDNDPLGGRSVNEFALEARYRFGNFGIVLFVDAGQVYRSSYPQFSDIRFGVGIGGRYSPNFGQERKSVVKGKSVSVRVDLGGSRLIKKKN